MRRVRTHWLVIVLLESLFFAAVTFTVARAERGFFGVGSKTLGGRFTWSDEVIYDGWRIQKSAVVGHYRLIDSDDRRYTFGTFEHCLEELDKVKVEKQLPPLPPSVVVVVHGLGASRQWMNELSDYLVDEGHLYVVNFGYPSTMGQIGDHAKSLTCVLQHLDGVKSVSFVAAQHGQPGDPTQSERHPVAARGGAAPNEVPTDGNDRPAEPRAPAWPTILRTTSW